MDPTRFDRFAKSLGQAHSRRTVFRTLGAAALGAVGLAGRPGGAQAAGCLTDADCDDNNACTIDHCDPATGLCSYTSVSCDDLDLCTDDFCDTETGCGHIPIDCDDGNPCTVNGCDSSTGCFNTVVSDGTPCTPNGGGNGSCHSGTCVACIPATTCPAGQTCGTAPDGCGGTVNCGACASWQTCQNGQCVTACPEGGTRCGDKCVSLAKDKNNCGGCGIRCGAKGVCLNGVCVNK